MSPAAAATTIKRVWRTGGHTKCQMQNLSNYDVCYKLKVVTHTKVSLFFSKKNFKRGVFIKST